MWVSVCISRPIGSDASVPSALCGRTDLTLGSECLTRSDGPCTQCMLSELLVSCPSNRQRVLMSFNENKCVWTRWKGSQQCACTSGIGADHLAMKGCQWGCSGISCNLGTMSSLGPDFYFTGSLIYSQNPTLGYVLLVPPMPLTVALANRQVICISTLPRPLYS